MITTKLKLHRISLGRMAVIFLLAQVLWLPRFTPAAAQTTVPAGSDYAPILSEWSPPQTNNGWWPALSPDARYVAYGNWGGSWVTDLQTGENHDLSRPADLPESGRCIGGKWIRPDTITFICDSFAANQMYRYEAKVGEWIPRRTADDPFRVNSNIFLARDGHWASNIAVTRIVKDNKTLVSNKPGGLMALYDNMLVHACSNSNAQICVWKDNVRVKTYVAKTPLFGADIYNNYIAYGGYGAVHGIGPNGIDVDLSAIKGFKESIPKLVEVNQQPWVVTDPWGNDGQFMLLRPWGERRSIVVDLQAVSFSVVHVPGKFIIAGNTDRGFLRVLTISDQTPRVDLCGEACRNVPLPPITNPPTGPNPETPVSCDETSEDPNAVLQCQIDKLENPPAPEYAPGEDPSQPVVFPADAVAGVAAAYNQKSDSVLIAAGKFVSDSNRQITGVIADAQTLAVKGTPFRLDGTGNGTAGTPKIAYSPDFEKYLVVWEDSRPCGSRCRSAYGRLVSADGAPIGSDFPINQSAAFLAGVTYDSVNKKFVVSYEFDGIFFRTVAEDATVSGQFKLPNYFDYQGQSGLAVNTALNQYWIAYATVVGGADTAREDDRIYYSRVDAKTLQVIGQPVQLSATRLGRLAVQGAHIAYSASGGAMVNWTERGREGIAGTWGRTIYNNGTLSDEYPVITTGNNSLSNSEGFGSSSIIYNQWTDSFFVPSGDWDGNAWITELNLDGSVYESKLVLSVVTAMARSRLARFLGIKPATAAAAGNFNVTSAATPYGAMTLASHNYSSLVGAQYRSVNAPSSSTTPPVTHYPPQGQGDLTAFPTLISKIYIWSLGVAGLLALLMSVIGAYSYMTAAGNAERASKGTEMIWASIIGLALLFGAYLLLNTINPELVNFRIGPL